MINIANNTTKYFVLLLIIIIVGCATTKVSVRKPETYKAVLCSFIEKKEGTIFPKNLTDRFTKGDVEKVHIFIEWYDLEIQTKNTVRYEWYDPKGEIAGSWGEVLGCKGTYCKTSGFMKLEGKSSKSPGQWTVKVFFNNHYIFSKKFMILENSADLKKMGQSEGGTVKKQSQDEKSNTTNGGGWYLREIGQFSTFCRERPLRTMRKALVNPNSGWNFSEYAGVDVIFSRDGDHFVISGKLDLDSYVASFKVRWIATDKNCKIIGIDEKVISRNQNNPFKFILPYKDDNKIFYYYETRFQ